ncbi:MAG: glycosyltransferase [Planctomycetota bacterium]
MIVKADLGRQDHRISSHRIQTKKVLHIINGEHFAGAERVQDLLGNALPQFGFEVGFVCVKPDRFPKVRHSDCDLFEVPMKSKVDLFSSRRIVEIARQGEYQLIHAHTPRSVLMGSMAAKKLHCPLVYHVHSPVGRDSTRGWANRINTWMEKFSLSRACKLICVSSSLHEYMEGIGHPTEKMEVVLNGVPAFEDLPMRQPPDGTWTIGTMALFRPRKGVEVLLDAISILDRQGIDLNLRAVGPFETPEYKTEIMERANSLGIQDKINWTGFQTDINEQLRMMDLFVLPSLFGEGLPMVVLEAMANAVPVIASDVEGIPEAVRDGVEGLIFEPSNPEDLAKKLATLIGDQPQWTAMSQSAWARQRNHLSDVSMARGVAKVYQELLT